MTPPSSFLFLTTVNLTANPRLAKELDLAVRNGFSATVLLFSLGDWGDCNDEALQGRFPTVRFIRLSALRRPFLPWLASSLGEKGARRLCRIVDRPSVNAMAVGKRYLPLRAAVRRLTGPFDWVIAHNPAAFHAAWYASRKFGARLGIDVEDYHPAETTDTLISRVTSSVMRHCILAADYASYASPLIRAHCDRDVAIPRGQGIEVQNWFPRSEFPEPAPSTSGPLRLVWFSQNIAGGRGLELVIPAISRLAGSVELHLYGKVDPSFRSVWLEGVPNVVYHGPVRQYDLHAALGAYDIGLAIDVLSDPNRDLVVTNKILAYLQAGLYLLVTETRAQRLLMQGFPAHGSLFPPEVEAFEKLLGRMAANPSDLRVGRLERYHAMSGHGWEQASEKLLKVWSGSS